MYLPIQAEPVPRTLREIYHELYGRAVDNHGTQVEYLESSQKKVSRGNSRLSSSDRKNKDGKRSRRGYYLQRALSADTLNVVKDNGARPKSVWTTDRGFPNKG